MWCPMGSAWVVALVGSAGRGYSLGSPPGYLMDTWAACGASQASPAAEQVGLQDAKQV